MKRRRLQIEPTTWESGHTSIGEEQQGPNSSAYKNLLDATYHNRNQLKLLAKPLPKMIERAANESMQGLVDLVDWLGLRVWVLEGVVSQMWAAGKAPMQSKPDAVDELLTCMGGNFGQAQSDEDELIEVSLRRGGANCHTPRECDYFWLLTSWTNVKALGAMLVLSLRGVFIKLLIIFWALVRHPGYLEVLDGRFYDVSSALKGRLCIWWSISGQMFLSPWWDLY